MYQLVQKFLVLLGVCALGQNATAGNEHGGGMPPPPIIITGPMSHTCHIELVQLTPQTGRPVVSRLDVLLEWPKGQQGNLINFKENPNWKHFQYGAPVGPFHTAPEIPMDALPSSLTLEGSLRLQLGYNFEDVEHLGSYLITQTGRLIELGGDRNVTMTEAVSTQPLSNHKVLKTTTRFTRENVAGAIQLQRNLYITCTRVAEEKK